MLPIKLYFPIYKKKACIRTACSLIDTCNCESNEGIKEEREMDRNSFSGSGFYVMCLVMIVAVLDIFLKKKKHESSS